MDWQIHPAYITRSPMDWQIEFLTSSFMWVFDTSIPRIVRIGFSAIPDRQKVGKGHPSAPWSHHAPPTPTCWRKALYHALPASQAASQPAGQPPSQPGSQPASKPASQHVKYHSQHMDLQPNQLAHKHISMVKQLWKTLAITFPNCWCLLGPTIAQHEIQLPRKQHTNP